MDRDHPTRGTIFDMTAIDLVAQIATALFAGGGMWLTVREIAKQVGETKRERIRQQGQTERLAIVRTMPPLRASQSVAKTTEKRQKVDAA